MIRRPVILGMNSPKGGEALSPSDGAGKRLFEYAKRYGGFEESQYLESFERINVLESTEWDRDRASEVARGWVKSMRFSGLSVVLLGHEVWDAFQLPEVPIFRGTVFRRTVWWRCPHPSGRSLVYNDEVNRERIGRLLSEVARPASHWEMAAYDDIDISQIAFWGDTE